MGNLEDKTHQYERALADAVGTATVGPPRNSPLGDAAAEVLEMSVAYYEDGGHFLTDDDYVNALAAFSYGHGWLDAGARVGLLDVSADDSLFPV